jgi:hypothetical protein
MKKIILACILALIFSPSVIAKSDSSTNEKVLAVFQKTFPEAKNPIWHSFEHLGHTFYEVYFKNDDNSSHKITYFNNGLLVQSLSYYKKENLNPVVRAKVAEEFPGKEIFSVTEKYYAGNVTLYINIEGEDSWHNIQISPMGHILKREKFNKN